MPPRLQTFRLPRWSNRWLLLGLAGAIAIGLTLGISLTPGRGLAQAHTPSPASIPAIKPAYLDQVVALVEQDQERLVNIFKDIHQNPELGFMETHTAEIVATNLRELGFEVQTGIGQTGVVGVLRNGEGPTVLYRADMDANAVEEATGLPYASTVRVKRTDDVEVPVAHMCGHDAHVTWMLGMAKAMVAMKDQWSGTLVVVGQPAEELIMGAQAMVDDGLYTTYNLPVPDYLVALHTAPIPTGTMATRGGVLMAGTDQIDVTFYGVGGHGSTPQLAKDPVVMAGMAIAQYQVIVSRVVNPLDTAVLTVGSVQAGTDNNVIPETALLKINLRFFDETIRQQMISGIRSINNGIARTYGMPEDQLPDMVMKGYSPPLVNDAMLVEQLTGPLQGLLGEGRVVTEFPPATGSEDAHLLRGPHDTVPVAYMAVGIADPNLFAQAQSEGKAFPFAAHNPNFQVDLAAIPLGTQMGTLSVLEILTAASS